MHFSNNNCYEVDKQCLDYKSGATKEICEQFESTSSDKICVLSKEKDECLEVVKGESSDGNNNNEGNKQNDQKVQNKQEERYEQNEEQKDDEEEGSGNLKNKSLGNDWLKLYNCLYIILILLY